MAISETKMQMVIANYFKDECDVNTSIRQAFEKGFRIGVNKGASMNRPQGEWVDSDGDIYCSNCGAEAPIDEWEYKYRDKIRQERTNFCPTCGVHMKGTDNG